MKVRDTDIPEVQLCEGENVKLTVDGANVFISAPAVNKTVIKTGAFTVSGDFVQIEAGRDVSITSVHPNKLIIGADFDKERAKILALEERIRNLELALSLLLKDRK